MSLVPLWIGGAALPELPAPTSLSVVDDADGHLVLSWQDPASVPHALRLIVQRGRHLVSDSAVTAGVQAGTFSGGGVWHGTLLNAGDNFSSRNSRALAFTLIVAPAPAALENGQLEGLESGATVALEDATS